MNILSLLFVTTLLSIFATGILLLLALTERNKVQLVLASMLGVLSVVVLHVLVVMVQTSEYAIATLYSPFRFRTLVLGLIIYLAAMSYYMAAARRNLFASRNGSLFSIPLLSTLVVYIAWHLGVGVSMDYTYASLSDICENIFTIPVILRILIYLFFLMYQVVMIYIMWHQDIMRSKHSVLNSSDAVSNIHWLRRVVVGIMAILMVYSLMIFIPCPWVYVLFCCTTTSVFVYFIYNTCVRRVYEDTDGWQAHWTPRNCWKTIEVALKRETETDAETNAETGVETGVEAEKPSDSEVADNVQPLDDIDYMPLIDQWMSIAKPFCNTEFSATNILMQFPEIDNKILQKLLQKEDGCGQSYIRRYRIQEACRIISGEKEIKVSELALRVGFSHTSSFSRSFSTVMGETVLQYMSKVGATRKLNKKAKGDSVK